MYDLTGKVALVTGSSRGLGKAIALDLARAGSTVVLNDEEGAEHAEKALAEVKAVGGEALFVLCDISRAEEVGKMVDTILDHYGKIDVLVNNAGISIDAKTAQYDIQAWDRVIQINLHGAFYCTRFSLPSMIRRQWGRIINVGSVVAQMGMGGTPAYTASKAALFGFTKTVAKEVARKGITVNCISLGYIEGGGLMDTVPEKLVQIILAQIPVGRLGRPEDITGMVNYLVSDSAAYITGQTLNINGGYFM